MMDWPVKTTGPWIGSYEVLPSHAWHGFHHRLSYYFSVNFYFLIFVSETNWPTGTKREPNPRKIRGQKVSKSVLSVFVCGVLFLNHSWWVGFFSMFLIKWSLYSMLTDFYGSYLFQDVRGSNWGKHQKIWNYYFKSNF